MWTFGNMRRNLVAIRTRRGESRSRAAMGIGITESGLRMLEDGKRCPSTRTLMDICRHYEVSPDELMGGWE